MVCIHLAGMVQFLVEVAKADISATTNFGRTTAQLAKEQNWEKGIKYLKEKER